MAGDPLGSGKSDFASEIEASEVPPEFMRNLYAALKSPLFAVPKPFETWMIDKVTSSGFDVPISQIVGFGLFTPEEATVATVETTVSTVYANLATNGPELTGLPDGSYLVQFGSRMANAVDAGLMSVSVNGGAASDNDACIVSVLANRQSLSRAVKKILSGGGNNTITAKYRVASGTGSFEYRWLVATRISNA